MLPGLKRLFLRRLMGGWARRHAPSRKPPRQVRLIALWQFGGVGDMLLATPVIEALHMAFPDAQIDIWCSNPPFAGFLKRFPAVRAIRAFPVYDFDSRTLLRSGVRRELGRLADAMAVDAPDVLVNLHVPALLDWWAVEWWLARRLSSSFSLGFDPHFIQAGSVFDVSLNAEQRDGIHYTVLYRRLLKAAGIACGEASHFPLEEAEEETAMALLREFGEEGRPNVCLHIGARRLKAEGRMWPADRFAVLAGKLVSAGYRPLLIGVQGEHDMAEALCARVPGCANLAGRTSLGEMAALIAACDGFIGHDSGPFHVAAAVGTPCVAICGRPDAEPEYLDYRRNDVLVLTADSPLEIAVDAVFESAMRVLAHG